MCRRRCVSGARILLVHEDQAQLKLEEGRLDSRKDSLPGWEMEGPSVMMPGAFLRGQKGLSMGARGRFSLEQRMACDRKHVL